MDENLVFSFNILRLVGVMKPKIAGKMAGGGFYEKLARVLPLFAHANGECCAGAAGAYEPIAKWV